MSKIRTPDDGSEDYFYKRGKTRSYGTPYNLTLYRFHEPILSPGEEADLIRAAKAGDVAAKDKLIRSFHRLILKIAAGYYGPPRDDQFRHDVIAAGNEGLWEAILRFDLRRNNGFAVYAEFWIRKHLHLAAQGYLKLNRADRVVYGNPTATPDQIAAKAGCDVAEAGAAIQRAEARRYSDSYDESGRYGKDRDGNEDYGDYTAPPAASSSDMYKMYGCFSSSQLSPHLGFHQCISRWFEELGVWHDKQATRLLRWMGRCRYANYLVRREADLARQRDLESERENILAGVCRPIPKPEVQQMGDSISINTAATASDSSDWMSDMERIERASKAQHPLVWTESDRYGVWRVIDQRPKLVVVATQSEKETNTCPPTTTPEAAAA
jgi:hypothetical protein